MPSAAIEMPKGIVKKMLDLSTAHMSPQDMELVERYAGAGRVVSLPRLYPHTYGAFLFTCSDPYSVECAVKALREAGFSEAFIRIYEMGCSDGEIVAINFDGDADQFEGLEVFEW